MIAPPHWQTIDFISDLHLQASEIETFELWQGYMQTTAAQAVFILGDLFEAWVGDDCAQQAGSFEAQCAQVLSQTASRLAVFFMRGNRDFLVGSQLAQETRFTLLDDPAVLEFSGTRYLLSHGDELCLDDVEYQQFRQQVRSAHWQQTFLAKPLPERQTIARQLREQSQARKDMHLPYADVDTQAACDWLQSADATVLIHGHTHRPADHAMSSQLKRVVLSDWDAKARRGEVLRLSESGLTRVGLF